MPQGPQAVAPSSRATSLSATAFKAAPQLASADGALLTGKGLKTALNKVAGASVVQAGVGRVAKVYVNTAPSGGTTQINDCATTGAAAAANLVCVIPNTVGIYDVDVPIGVGLCLTVGTAGVVSISYQ